MTSTTEWSLTARWVFPVAAPPIERGVVVIAGDKLVGVEPAGRRTPDIDLGNAAVIPGLVNAHTHLDLSAMRGRVPPSADFTGWLRAVIAGRAGTSPDDVDAGIAESLRFGTTLVGDIAAGGASWDALADAPMWAVVYREMLGLTADRARQAMADAVMWLVTHPATDTCRPGLSPHAPYSVRFALFRKVAELAREAPIPVASHVGETLDEIRLLADRAGPFVPFLKELRVYDADGLSASLAELLELFRGNPTFAIAHGNYLETCVSTDALVAATRVYCPRTHAAFGHAPYPLAGPGRFALGTDGLASNPDLDVFAEAHFAAMNHPHIAKSRILEMATRNGAEVLGFGDVTGTLEPGKSADLVAIPLPDGDSGDAYAMLFGPAVWLDAPRRTLWRGEWREVKD